MENSSIWLSGINSKHTKSLNSDKSVDVLIIGGGITGLSTAYHLINSGLNVLIVEMNEIAHGISARTTGKLTFLQENIYTKLKSNKKMYYDSQVDALNIVENIIDINNIKCDYKKVTSYLFTDKENNISKTKKIEKILSELNVSYKIGTTIPDNINSVYSISVDNTAVFHPVKYLYALYEIIIMNNIKVYENTSVTDIKKSNNGYICTANNHTIQAKKVVIASHYPFFLLPYLMPLKTSIEKSYISSSIVSKINDYSAITISKPTKSIRYHSDNKDYFIYLNGSHNISNKLNDLNNFDNLLSDLKELNLSPSYIWSNHDILTEDSLPYIGFIDDNLLIGTGYNTWGMTNGSLAGVILSDLIIGKDNKYKSLFDPKRIKGLGSLKYPLNMSYSAKSMIENKIQKNKSWYNRVRFENINGKSIGIYTDIDGEHKILNICPHMKCSLVFNEVEKTWDCPCHGSRFDIDGHPLIGPSNIDIGFKE